MATQQDDTVGGRRAFNKFLIGGFVGAAILIAAIAVSSYQMKAVPISAPPPNAGATK